MIDLVIFAQCVALTFFLALFSISSAPIESKRLCREPQVHLSQPHQCPSPHQSSLIIPHFKAALSPHLVSECQTHCTAESAAVSLHRILGTALLFSHTGFALDTDTSCIREQGHAGGGGLGLGSFSEEGETERERE